MYRSNEGARRGFQWTLGRAKDMYLFPLVAIVNGSTISNAHISKDFFGVSVIFSGVLA